MSRKGFDNIFLILNGTEQQRKRMALILGNETTLLWEIGRKMMKL